MSGSKEMAKWHRNSAIAAYPGFHSYLEACGERMRFVLDCKIEHASEVPKLRQFIDCMSGILQLTKSRYPREDDPMFPDEGIAG